MNNFGTMFLLLFLAIGMGILAGFFLVKESYPVTYRIGKEERLSEIPLREPLENLTVDAVKGDGDSKPQDQQFRLRRQHGKEILIALPGQGWEYRGNGLFACSAGISAYTATLCNRIRIHVVSENSVGGARWFEDQNGLVLYTTSYWSGDGAWSFSWFLPLLANAQGVVVGTAYDPQHFACWDTRAVVQYPGSSSFTVLQMVDEPGDAVMISPYALLDDGTLRVTGFRRSAPEQLLSFELVPQVQ